MRIRKIHTATGLWPVSYTHLDVYKRQDVDYAVELLEQSGWTDTDGDGIRDKDGQKLAFNLMYFAGDSMRQAVAMSVANQAKENMGFEINVEGVSEDETIKRMFSEPMIMGWGSDSPMTSYMPVSYTHLFKNLRKCNKH